MSAKFTTTILRSSDRHRDQLVVTADGKHLQLALTCGRETLAAGPWAVSVAAAGTPLASAEEWQETCRFADEDVDYLELELGLHGGGSVQRQILLARRDRFVYLADAVLGGRTVRRLEYSGTLLEAGVPRGEPNSETRWASPSLDPPYEENAVRLRTGRRHAGGRDGGHPAAGGGAAVGVAGVAAEPRLAAN